LPIDVFGIYEGTEGTEIVEHGWLTAETVIQFKIANDPILLWKKKFKNVPVRESVGVDDFYDFKLFRIIILDCKS
jgi:hypothetical protein